METIKFNMSDHGTWSKHLTVHQSIYIIPFPLKYGETTYVFPEHRNLRPCDTDGLKKESASSRSVFSFL
jgi:hypothetical protein